MVRCAGPCTTLFTMADCRTINRSITKTFEWQVDGMATLVRQPTGYAIFSSVFQDNAGHKWQLKMYPNGSSCSDRVSVFLQSDARKRGIRFPAQFEACFDIHIVHIPRVNRCRDMYLD